MNKSKRMPLRSLCSLLLACIIIALSITTVYAQPTLRWGSQGGDVYDLQGRLKKIGYYHGKIDGIFGRQTYWAVRNFQYRFGMKVDGVAGKQTWSMLKRATSNLPKKSQSAVSTSYGLSANDINLLTRAVYSEARGEPYEGQVAIAAVILNRVESSKFPNTISGVIFEPRAFTAIADGQFWLTPNHTAKKAAYDAINGWDPTGGAIYYFNPNTATSPWIWSRPQVRRIGKHIFSY
nr:spore cortex-lytic enzyme [Rubeoparvulum massiliense]